MLMPILHSMIQKFAAVFALRIHAGFACPQLSHQHCLQVKTPRELDSPKMQPHATTPGDLCIVFLLASLASKTPCHSLPHFSFSQKLF
jgi:hypothetical protein